jgi:hypothetical protein
MKLIIPHCRNCNTPITLDRTANSRGQLRALFGGNYFRVQCGTCQTQATYNVADVKAEEGTKNTTTGALVGGLVGILGGPLGIAIGAGIGGLIGNGSDTDEKNKVRNFNESW